MTLALLCLAQFVVVLDVTIVAVALPAAGRDLGGDPAQLQWVVTAYTVTFSGLLVFGGRIADVVGRRRTFTGGLILFAAASLACGLAPGLGVLITARAVQGAGAALLAPAALALLTAMHPEGPSRRRALAWWTAAAAGGGAAGWILGGLVATGPGWRWIFLVNVPSAAAGSVLAVRLLPASRGGKRRLDLPGALAATAALSLLVLALAAIDAGTPGTAAALLAAAALATGTFWLVERRGADPLIPRRLAGDRTFGAANAVAAVLTAATTPPLLLCVLHLQGVRGRSAIETGLVFAPVNLAVIAGSLVAPRVLARLGPRAAAVAGVLGVAGGAATLVALPAQGGYLPALLPAFVAMGLGLGLAATASTAAGLATADPADHGVASGVLGAAAQAGTALGLAGLVGLAAGVADTADSVAGVRTAAVAAALLAIAGAALTRPFPGRATAAAQAPGHAQRTGSRRPAGPATTTPAPFETVRGPVSC